MSVLSYALISFPTVGKFVKYPLTDDLNFIQTS